MSLFKMNSARSFAVVNKYFIRNIAVNSSGVAENVKSTQYLKPFKAIPGPPSYPLIGPFFSFLNKGQLGGYKGIRLSKRLHELYGPIVRLDGIFGQRAMVMLADPEAAENVLRAEETMPTRPGIDSLTYYRMHHNKTYDPKLLTGLGSDQGENWRAFRTKVNPILMQPKTIKLYTKELDEVADDMVKRLRSTRDENNKIPNKFNFEINLWALESVGVVALGGRLNCFDPNLPEDSPVRKLIQNVHDIFHIAGELDFAPSAWRVISTPLFKKAMKIYEDNENLTKYFIDQAIKNMKKSENKSAEDSNLEKPILEKLLDIDAQIAHIMATDMLVGGVDTVSNTMIATLYLLAKNPEKQNKLREEILSKQPRRPYLKACLKESMRMHSVSNGNVRLSTKDHSLLGYKIPKDILMIFSHQYMSILEEQYPKPDKFIPERWLADKNDPLYHGNAHRFAMAPFGFGIRMCIGRRMAELELETMTSKMIENFQIDWTSEEPIQVATSMFNYIKEPFYFTFKDL